MGAFRTRILVVALIAGLAHAQVPLPREIVVARETFADYGPPFQRHELFLLRASSGRVEIERLIVGESRNSCTDAPQRTVMMASLVKPLPQLFGGVNPCQASDAVLLRHHPCKDCVFMEGSNVALQFNCRGKTRLLRLPPGAFWPGKTGGPATALVRHLNRAFGGKNEAPMMQDLAELLFRPNGLSFALQAQVLAGDFDALFNPEAEKLSNLYARSFTSTRARGPIVELVSPPSRSPVAPLILPSYSLLAEEARIETLSKVAFHIGASGEPTELEVLSGHPLFEGVVKQTVLQWRFEPGGSSGPFEATFRFRRDCLPLK